MLDRFLYEENLKGSETQGHEPINLYIPSYPLTANVQDQNS